VKESGREELDNGKKKVGEWKRVVRKHIDAWSKS